VIERIRKGPTGDSRGVSLVELVVVTSIVGLLVAVGIPEYSNFTAKNRVRRAANDLLQNMRLARTIAVKENREYMMVFDTTNNRYLIGFDNDGDSNLTTVNSDGFQLCGCVDADGDGGLTGNERIPSTDADSNGDGVPDCVRVVNMSEYGSSVIIGYATGTKPPVGPGATPTSVPDSGVTFSGSPPTAEFNENFSLDKLGSIYLQEDGKGYTYCVRISNTAAVNMWAWKGDEHHPNIEEWTEVR